MQNLWHLARWADHLQATFPRLHPRLGRELGPGEAIWPAEGPAQAWRSDLATLGWNEVECLRRAQGLRGSTTQ